MSQLPTADTEMSKEEKTIPSTPSETAVDVEDAQHSDPKESEKDDDKEREAGFKDYLVCVFGNN